MKNFCSMRNPVKMMKRQIADWEKTFTNHVANECPSLEYIRTLKTQHFFKGCLKGLEANFSTMFYII